MHVGSLAFFFFLSCCLSRKWKVRKSSADPFNMVRRPMDVKKNMRTAIAPRFLRARVGCWPQLEWRQWENHPRSDSVDSRLSQSHREPVEVGHCRFVGGEGDPRTHKSLSGFFNSHFFQSFALTVLCLLGSHSLGPLFVLSKHTRWGDLAVCVRT